MNKRSFRFLLSAAAATLLCIAVGFLMMLAVSLLPAERIEKNVRLSAYTLEKEGIYPQLDSINGRQQLDNFTDALMLGVAADKSEKGVLDQALSNRYLLVDGQNPYYSFYSYYNRSSDAYENTTRIPYPRYWHGYLVLLRPLLCLLRYYQIRKLYLAVQLFMLALCVFLLIRRKLARCAIPFLLSVLLLSPLVIAHSLQYSSVYMIMLLSVIILLLFDKKAGSETFTSVLFAVTGCCTSFMDLLTAPLLTLCFPLTIYFCLVRPSSLRSALGAFLRLCCCWGIGYAGMWAGKWLLATLLTEHDVFASAFLAASQRTSFTDDRGNAFTYIDVLHQNWQALRQSPVWALSLAVMVFSAIRSIRSKKRILSGAACFAPVALLPFAWFYVMSNHTYWHFWFTHRIYAAVPFALMCLFLFPMDAAPTNEKK